VDEVLDWYLDSYAGEKEDPEAWNLAGLHLALKETFGLDLPVSELKSMGRAEMKERLGKAVLTRYEEKERAVGPELMLFHQRMIMLQIVDTQWKDHLYSLDHLKEGIGLRGYGQRDPLVEYKKESFQMFQDLMDRIDEEILRWSFLYQPVAPAEARSEPLSEPALARAQAPERAREPELALVGVKTVQRNLSYNDPSATSSTFARQAQPREASGGTDDVQTVRREGPKVGRNDPCPCGSRKKYKKCHGS
jgi:preprotein translocase subunit SecA